MNNINTYSVDSKIPEPKTISYVRLPLILAGVTLFILFIWGFIDSLGGISKSYPFILLALLILLIGIVLGIYTLRTQNIDFKEKSITISGIVLCIALLVLSISLLFI